MKRDVTFIRSILDTFIEKYLVVEYYNFLENEYEIVQYENRNLTFYKYKKSKLGKELEVECKIGDGLGVRFFDSKNDLIDISSIEEKKELSNQALDQLVSLNNAREVYLSNDTKAIIEAYKLFYNENPDFSKEDINLKIQTMIIILNQFNLFGDYQFSIQDGMLESYKLTDMVNKLFLLGEVTVIKYPIEFKERAKEIIKIVGATIKEKVGKEESLNEVLLSISKTIYASNFDYSSLSDTEELVKYPNLELTSSEVKDSIRLVHSIYEKVEKSKLS